MFNRCVGALVDNPRDRSHDDARAIVLRHGWNATAYQLLNPGIAHWFSPDGDVLVGYVVASGTRVVAGAPVCSPSRLHAAVEAFVVDARRHRQRVCFFGAGERLEGLLAPMPDWSVASLGAQPAWDPSGWPAIVARRASLRGQLHRARNKGVRVRVWDATRAEASTDLRRCLAGWLSQRPLPPLHFLIESDTLANLTDRLVLVAEVDDVVIGFLIGSPIPARNGWLIEQIIRGSGVVNGTTELLIDAAMRTIATRGARHVTLGLSPLSRHSSFDRRRMPSWLRATLHLTRAHCGRFYNFGGIDQFKAKFEPDVWEEIVAIADAPRFPPSALWAIAAAFSRGSPISLVLRAAAKRLIGGAR